MTSEPTGWLDRWRISPAAARLARAALQQRCKERLTDHCDT